MGPIGAHDCAERSATFAKIARNVACETPADASARPSLRMCRAGKCRPPSQAGVILWAAALTPGCGARRTGLLLSPRAARRTVDEDPLALASALASALAPVLAPALARPSERAKPHRKQPIPAKFGRFRAISGAFGGFSGAIANVRATARFFRRQDDRPTGRRRDGRAGRRPRPIASSRRSSSAACCARGGAACAAPWPRSGGCAHA